MRIKCLSTQNGDYFDIEIGKEYEVIKTIGNRYLIKDDIDCEYSYPISCFKNIENLGIWRNY